MIVIHTIIIFHEPFQACIKTQGFEQESLESVRHFLLRWFCLESFFNCDAQCFCVIIMALIGTCPLSMYYAPEVLLIRCRNLFSVIDLIWQGLGQHGDLLLGKLRASTLQVRSVVNHLSCVPENLCFQGDCYAIFLSVMNWLFFLWQGLGSEDWLSRPWSAKQLVLVFG